MDPTTRWIPDSVIGGGLVCDETYRPLRQRRHPTPIRMRSVHLAETPAIQPPRKDPPNEIVTCLMYSSLLQLAAFVVTLGKQWLNRYLRDWRGSVTVLRGSSAKCDGFEKWLLHFSIEGLLVGLQVTLPTLPTQAVCQHLCRMHTVTQDTR